MLKDSVSPLGPSWARLHQGRPNEILSLLPDYGSEIIPFLICLHGSKVALSTFRVCSLPLNLDVEIMVRRYCRAQRYANPKL